MKYRVFSSGFILLMMVISGFALPQPSTDPMLSLWGYYPPGRAGFWPGNGMIESAGDYTFSSATGSYTPISGGTVSSASGDEGAENILLPFLFIYDSLIYTTARISVNGWLEFGQSFTGAGYVNELASPEARPLVAPFWDDLYDDATSQVRYETLGSSPARTFVVEWQDIRWVTSTGARQNFQLRLYEGTNTIEFIYGSMANSTNTSASIGLNDPVGGSGHFLSITPGNPPTSSTILANDAISSISSLPSGTVYRFTPACFHLWDGSLNSDWFEAANWNCGIVPATSANVTIPAGTINLPVLSSDAFAGVLGIENGANLILSGGNLTLHSLRLNGRLTVSGSEWIDISGTTHAWYRDVMTGVFEPGMGTVVFSGGKTATTNSPATFYNVTIQAGKALDPGQNPFVSLGSFNNAGTFWSSSDLTTGSEFYGAVVNSGVWKGREGPVKFINSFSNENGAVFNGSLDPVIGVEFYKDMLNKGELVASDLGKMTARANWQNDGLFIPGSGQVWLAGNGYQEIRSSSGTNEFCRLVIATGSQVRMNNNIRILENLEIQSGAFFELGGFDVTVDGVLSNYGGMGQDKVVPAGLQSSFLQVTDQTGAITVYRGVEIMPEGEMGETRVEIHGNQSACNSTNELIHRCFSISPETLQAARIRFWYLNDEKGTENPTTMKAFHWDGAAWGELSLAAIPRGTQGNYEWVEAVDVASYSQFGLADDVPGDPTVVEIINFQGEVGKSSLKSIAIVVLLVFFSIGIMMFASIKRTTEVGNS